MGAEVVIGFYVYTHVWVDASILQCSVVFKITLVGWLVGCRGCVRMCHGACVKVRDNL